MRGRRNVNMPVLNDTSAFAVELGCSPCRKLAADLFEFLVKRFLRSKKREVKDCSSTREVELSKKCWGESWSVLTAKMGSVLCNMSSTAFILSEMVEGLMEGADLEGSWDGWKSTLTLFQDTVVWTKFSWMGLFQNKKEMGGSLTGLSGGCSHRFWKCRREIGDLFGLF